MAPSSHLTRLLQRSSHQQHDYYLVHVHQLLQVMMRQHKDPPYLADTRDAATTDPTIGYRTFQVGTDMLRHNASFKELHIEKYPDKF